MDQWRPTHRLAPSSCLYKSRARGVSFESRVFVYARVLTTAVCRVAVRPTVAVGLACKVKATSIGLA